MAATEKPNMGELAAPEDPFNPLKRAVSGQLTPYTQILQSTDTILQIKGGIENLKIYRELLRDDQVASVWLQRRLALVSCDTVVEPGGTDALSIAAAKALDEELQAMEWDDTTDKMLYSVFYGWGVGEVLWKRNGNRVSFDKIKVRDRARFRFDIAGNLYLWTTRGQWELMPPRKFWTVTTGADNHDEPYGLGLAHALYWPVFFKRNDVKFWLMFLEKFGMPTAMAKVPAGQINDPKTVNQALTMLRQIATDAGVVVPDNVVVELLEAARSGSADYAGMHDAMNSAISKIVVGQTMTTDNGSSLAQAQVHERVGQKVVEADSDLLCGSFNNGPVKWWTEWNFPGAKPPRVYRHTSPPEDMAARAERDTKIKALGYEPTETYITETYGDGWEKVAPAPDPIAIMAGMASGKPVGKDGEDDKEGDPGGEFAEGESVALAAMRSLRRGDQQAIFNAARMFSEQYQTVTGKRIAQVLQAAEFSEDAETFTRRINEILAEQPSDGVLEKLRRGLMFGSLLGAMRGQRKK